jgi:signal peptidase II
MSEAIAGAGRTRWLWLVIIVVVADRATKECIERLTSPYFRLELVPHFAALVHSVNTGMAFGLLGESSTPWTSIFLMVVAAAVVGFLIWWLLSGRAGGTLTQTGLALIAGGAAGNLLDRLLHGGVTDFVELHAGSFVWPAFNLADSAITIGALLIIGELLRSEQHSAQART